MNERRDGTRRESDRCSDCVKDSFGDLVKMVYEMLGSFGSHKKLMIILICFFVGGSALNVMLVYAKNQKDGVQDSRISVVETKLTAQIDYQNERLDVLVRLARERNKGMGITEE